MALYNAPTGLYIYTVSSPSLPLPQAHLIMLYAAHRVEQTRLPYTARSSRLLDQLRDVIRLKHYSLRTEEAYVDWVRRFVRFCALRHPSECGAADVEAFLTHLATAANVSASTQNQARSALLFLYKEVLGCDL